MVLSQTTKLKERRFYVKEIINAVRAFNSCIL